MTITLGAVVSGIALAAHLLAPTHRITEMWLWPIAAVGQTALVGAGLNRGDMLTTTDAFLAGAALATIEAALVATYATVRLDQAARESLPGSEPQHSDSSPRHSNRTHRSPHE